MCFRKDSEILKKLALYTNGEMKVNATGLDAYPDYQTLNQLTEAFAQATKDIGP